METRMPATTKPKSRLPGGRINPAYTKWRKEQFREKPLQEGGVTVFGDLVAKDQPPGELDSIDPHKLDSAGSIPAPATSEFLTLRVLKLARNSNFVLCAQDGVSIPVRVKRGIGPKLIKKDIRVENREGTLYHAP